MPRSLGRVRPLVIAALLLCVSWERAPGMALSARRLGLGGAAVPSLDGLADRNVAYRALPRAEGHTYIPLPLGLVQLAADPPEFDPDDPDFNVLEIVDLAVNPPFHLQLVSPEVPSSDILVYASKDSVVLDLGAFKEMVPPSDYEVGALTTSPRWAMQFGPWGFSLGPVVEGRHELGLSDQLRGALAEAQPMTSGRTYGVSESARVQMGISADVSYAMKAYKLSFRETEAALYVGGRAKYIRGIAYGEASGAVSLTPTVSLDGVDEPFTADVQASARFTSSDGIGRGNGVGFDLGAVMRWGSYEVGLGVNDVVTRIRWKTDLYRYAYNDSTGKVETIEEADGESFTSKIPTTLLFNVVKRWKRQALVFDVEKGVTDWTFHAGFERYLPTVTLRAGTFLDTKSKLQIAGGIGVGLGPLGLDVAVATHSRDIADRRGLELAASIALRRGPVGARL